MRGGVQSPPGLRRLAACEGLGAGGDKEPVLTPSYLWRVSLLKRCVCANDNVVLIIGWGGNNLHWKLVGLTKICVGILEANKSHKKLERERAGERNP